MDYSAVAPPSSAPGENTAFADALARARQIAAKIGGSTSGDASLKRPYDGIGDGQPDPKKMAAINDPIGAQLKAIADQQRAQQTQQAVQAAANAAAQINAKLGIPTQGGPPDLGEVNMGNDFGPGFGGGLGGGLGAGLGMVTTENFQVPDRMVGLVIGKGGENIAMIQSETGVKVQFAQDSGGLTDRPCTLTGSQDGINKAKELISKIIVKGSGLPDGASMADGVVMEEVMIPGSKVGLVIGKGGENIKMLQERAGVKMVMIQDSNIPSHQDKPLRITGEPHRVAQAKEMVFDLLAEKETQAAGFGGAFAGGKNDVTVPRSLVGVIIGKGGEMIKKITQDTGARVQLKPDDGQAPERVCQVTGSPEQVEAATQFIESLLDSASQRQQGGGGPGLRGPQRRGGPMERGGPGDRGGPRQGGFKDETTYVVPADKTGLVIGKGGETVKEINRVTGCWVELSRDRPPNPHDRIFHLSGTPDQIKQAIHMICEKAGLPPPSNGGGPGGPPGGPGSFGGPGGPGPGGPGGFNQGPGCPSPAGGMPPSSQSLAPQGWGNAYQQYQNAGQNDPNKQAADANAAAWAAYYQNLYGQQPQQQPPQQPAQPPQQPQAYQPPQQQPAQPAAPSINPVTGQPDYSMAWAEYYRQQGMHAHAQAILQQAQQQGQGQPPQ